MTQKKGLRNVLFTTVRVPPREKKWKWVGPIDKPITFAVFDQPTAVVVEDFNGDGNLDLAVANKGPNVSLPDKKVSILLGTGDGSFGAATNFNTGLFDARSLTVADFDGDGLPEIGVAGKAKYVVYDPDCWAPPARSGGQSGTATAPAYRHASSATTKSSPGG